MTGRVIIRLPSVKYVRTEYGTAKVTGDRERERRWYKREGAKASGCRPCIREHEEGMRIRDSTVGEWGGEVGGG